MSDHVNEDRLLAYLDDELDGAERQRVAEHLTGCESCSDRLASLERAARTLTAALEELDREAPQVDAEALRPQGRRLRPFTALPGALLKVAAVLLLVAGGATAAIPGVRGWLIDSIERAVGWAGGGPESDLDRPDTAAADRASDPGRVSLPLLNGRIEIEVVEPAPDAYLRVVLVETDQASVRATGARYRTAAGRITVIGGTAADIRVELPRTAAAARVTVDGQLYLQKRGANLELLKPPVDSTATEIRFRTGR